MSFDIVKDPNFNGWEKAAEISEAELFAAADMQANAAAPLGANPEPVVTTVNTTITQQATPQGTNIGNFMSEDLAVELIDTAGSTLGVLGLGMAGVKVTKSAFAATAREKELLKQPTRAMLDAMNFKVTNHFEAFLYAFLGVYASKAAIIYMQTPAREKPAKQIQETQGSEPRRRHTGKANCICPKCIGSNG